MKQIILNETLREEVRDPDTPIQDPKSLGSLVAHSRKVESGAGWNRYCFVDADVNEENFKEQLRAVKDSGQIGSLVGRI